MSFGSLYDVSGDLAQILACVLEALENDGGGEVAYAIVLHKVSRDLGEPIQVVE